jgi:hypothetical protein
MGGKNGFERKAFQTAINQGVSPEIATLIREAVQAQSEGETEELFFTINMKNKRFEPDWKDRFLTARQEATEIGLWPWK